MSYAFVNYLMRAEGRIDKALAKLMEEDSKQAQQRESEQSAATATSTPAAVSSTSVDAGGSKEEGHGSISVRVSRSLANIVLELNGHTDVRSRMRTTMHLTRMDMLLVRPDGRPYLRALHVELFSRYVYIPVFAIFNMIIYLQLAPVVPIITCDRS